MTVGIYPFAHLTLAGHAKRTTFPVSGAGGCFYDPNDLSTMFQDVAGTIPCAVDSTVALIKDKGPFGYDASQSDSAQRPTLKKDSATGRHFLRYGPSDQRLVTEAVIPRTTGTMFSAVAVQNISNPTDFPIYLTYRGGSYDDESRLPMFVYIKSASKMAVQFGSSGEVQFTTNMSLKKVFSCTTVSGTLTAYDNGSFVTNLWSLGPYRKKCLPVAESFLRVGRFGPS